MARSPVGGSEWTAAPPEDYCIADLSGDILVLVLEYLPLDDLANMRLVCSRFQQIVDDCSVSHLWATCPVEAWVTPANQAVMQRAAECGNVEALIKQAVANLYSEGVPDGPGKGTVDALNGLRATDYLSRAERLSRCAQPFAWVLFRAPWAPGSLCCKASVCHQMKVLCEEAEEGVSGLHYCVGKALSFHQLNDVEQRRKAMDWYQRGASRHCPYSALEIWRLRHKPTISDSFTNEIHCIRQLRETASSMVYPDPIYPEAQFELCEAYAQGYYGGMGKDAAYEAIRQTMAAAQPTHCSHISQLQRAMTPNMRYILIDWLSEVSEMKELPSPTFHLAVSLLNRYMLHRRVPMTQFQLLGITALLVAARWMGLTIITIREAAWLTDYTYKYEEVVRRMGELVAALRGNLRRTTVSDYLSVLLHLVEADEVTRCMATFLSECLLLHLEFQRYSAAQLAAACVLNSRILLGQEYPWPSKMVQATGFTVAALQKCCLTIYHKCLSGSFSIKDHRQVELHSVKQRFATDRFCNVSKHQIMSFKQFKSHLGVEPDSPCLLLTPNKTPKQKQRTKAKVFSFLSDSCYLSSSPSQLGKGGSSSESVSESDSEMSSSECEVESVSSFPYETETETEEEEDLVEQFSTQRLSSTGSSSAASPTLDLHSPPLLGREELDSHLYSLQREEEKEEAAYCEQASACAIDFKPLDFTSTPFPQPTFSDCESDSESENQGSPGACHPQCSFGERMDTSDHHVAQLPPHSPSYLRNRIRSLPSCEDHYPIGSIPHVPDFELREPSRNPSQPSSFSLSANNANSYNQENLTSRERTGYKKIGDDQFNPSLQLQRAALRQVENVRQGCHFHPSSPGAMETRKQPGASKPQRKRRARLS